MSASYPCWVIPHRFWSVITGVDIPLNVQVGGDLLLPHLNWGVMLPTAVIGLGAEVLDGIAVADHDKIGANAVVLGDGPSLATALGVAARTVTISSNVS